MPPASTGWARVVTSSGGAGEEVVRGVGVGVGAVEFSDDDDCDCGSCCVGGWGCWSGCDCGSCLKG